MEKLVAQQFARSCSTRFTSNDDLRNGEKLRSQQKEVFLALFFSAERRGPHPTTVPRLPPRHGLLHVHRNERHPARRQQDHQTRHRL